MCVLCARTAVSALYVRGGGITPLKGFSDLSADAGELALKGDYGGAAANVILNIATAGVALLARLKAEKVFLEAPADVNS